MNFKGFRGKFCLSQVLAGCLLLCAVFPIMAADWVVVYAGQLLAVPGKDVQSKRSIVIKDGLVQEVRKGDVTAKDIDMSRQDTLTIHDLSGYFVLPGLIDGHVHLTDEWSARSKLDAVEFSTARIALEAAVHARRTLMTGITTVRDLGGNRDAIIALRDVINHGDLPGPRIFAAGNMISPSGGPGDFLGYNSRVTTALRDTSAVCDGPADCRRAVREQVMWGADVIKLTATGAVTSESNSGTGQLFFDDELKAIVDTAHQLGRRVTAHAHGAEGIKAALRAGVDSIEHGTFTDGEAIRLFLTTGAYLIPTLLPGRIVLELAADPNSFMADSVREKSMQVAPQSMQHFSRAFKAGVNVAFGSDSGVGKHGDNLRELLLLVEGGMTPEQAIVAATVGCADNMGMLDKLGSIIPGAYADIIAVDGNPLVSIKELLDVDFVMKEGILYKAASGH